jgi:hypothetical protein
MPSNQDDRLDLERSAVLRLKADALEKLRLAQQKESYSERWWNGYVQALEHVLAMEHE